MRIKEIFLNNKNWIQQKTLLDKSYFQKLSLNQKPDILYFGCSDSRVTAEELMGAEPGEAFIHRNIANLILHEDLSSQSVLEFALLNLKVKHIVICGHYECGGVRASFEKNSFNHLNQWLVPLKTLQKTYKKDLDLLKTQQQKEDFLVEISVKFQCEYLLNHPLILKSKKINHFPKIHGWIFNIRSGELLSLFQED